jgi:inner membrane protein
MMGRTHLLLGLNALWLLEGIGSMALTMGMPAPLAVPLGNGERFVLCTGLATLGALLPDLDAASSLLQNASIKGVQPLVPLGQVLHRRYGHRGYLHSLSALARVGFLSSPLLLLDIALWFWPWVSLLLGYLSHLLGDACTKSGVPLFWKANALKQQSFHLLPKPLRLTTGSQAEEAVFALLGALALSLALRHLPAF